MLRTLLFSLAILAAPPVRAASLGASYVVERGDAARVKHAPEASGRGAAVDLIFGMGRAASRGFVAAAGRAEDGVTVARGPRTRAQFCPAAIVRLP